MERFVREAKSAAALNPPSHCDHHEIGESGDVTFIAMDFIDGLTLREKIHQAPTQTNKVAASSSTRRRRRRVTGKCFACRHLWNSVMRRSTICGFGETSESA